MKVGNAIKNYLNDHGISQVWLSTKTGIPTARLCLELNGKRRMNFDDYAAICAALGIPTGPFIEPCPLEAQEGT